MVKSVTIVPSGAGTATVEVYREGGPGPDSPWTGTWKTFKVQATPAEGFEFERWEWDYEYTRGGETTTGAGSAYINPYSTEYPDWIGRLCEYSVDYHDPDLHWEQTITAVRAIFRDTRGTVRVIVEVKPSDATEAGCTATVDGSSESEKMGTDGSYVTFNLNASAPDGWKFRYWRRYGAKSGKESEKTISERVVGEGMVTVVDYMAVFTKVTGEILYADGGGVLCSGNGDAMFKG